MFGIIVMLLTPGILISLGFIALCMSAETPSYGPRLSEEEEKECYRRAYREVYGDPDPVLAPSHVKIYRDIPGDARLPR
jgi:hypothetical protein